MSFDCIKTIMTMSFVMGFCALSAEHTLNIYNQFDEAVMVVVKHGEDADKEIAKFTVSGKEKQLNIPIAPDIAKLKIDVYYPAGAKEALYSEYIKFAPEKEEQIQGFVVSARTIASKQKPSGGAGARPIVKAKPKKEAPKKPVASEATKAADAAKASKACADKREREVVKPDQAKDPLADWALRAEMYG